MPVAALGAAIGGMSAGTAAAVGAVGAIGGSLLSSSASNRAADKAAQASQYAADQSAAVQRDIYGQNKDILAPWVQQGQQSTGMINALLGIPQAQQPAAPPAMPGYGYDVGGMYPNYGIPAYQQTSQPAQPQITQPTAQQAFDTFRNSTGYQFRLNQGLNALNSGYAGAGTIKSGAAMKGAVDYGQGMASQEFGNYLNALGNQQGVGLQAGSALAGVGQNMANSLGQIYMTNGENQANAALLKGKNTSNMFNSIGSILTKTIGGFGG